MRTTSSSDSSCGVGVGVAAGTGCCAAALGCGVCGAGVLCGVWLKAGASSERTRSGATKEGCLFIFGSP